MASKLSDPTFAKAVAEAYVKGLSRAEMSEIFNVSKETISVWTADPRVVAHAGKLAQARVLRITRKIDSEIENRLGNVDKMPEEMLLKIRKEYIDRALRVDIGAGASDPAMIGDTVKAFEDNPDMAAALASLLNGKQDDGREGS